MFSITGLATKSIPVRELVLRAMDWLIYTLRTTDNIKSDRDVYNIKYMFDQLASFLPGPITSQKLTHTEEKLIMDVVLEKYSVLLRFIVTLLLPQWPVFKDEITDLFLLEDNFFVGCEALTTITGFLKMETNPDVIRALSHILHRYIKSDSIFVAIIDSGSVKDVCEGTKYTYQMEWDNYVQLLATLPERLANKMEMDTPKDFSNENYAYHMVFHMIRSFEFISDAFLYGGTQYDMVYLCHLMSKIVTNFNMSGNSPAILNLVDVIIAWHDVSYENPNKFIKRKLTQMLLQHLNRESIDTLSIMFLNRCQIDYDKDRQIIYDILFDSFDICKDWAEILAFKLPFYFKPKNFKRTVIAENLIYYISTITNNVEGLTDLIMRLARVWADVKPTNVSNISQHIFTSQLLILAIKYRTVISIRDKLDWPLTELKTILFKGMSKHLDVWFQEYQCVGMTTIEVVLKTLADLDHNDKEAANSLKFEYSEMGETCIEINKILRHLAQRCLIDRERRKPKNYKVEKIKLTEILDGIANRVVNVKSEPTGNTLVTCAVKSQEQTKEIVKAIISVKLDAFKREKRPAIEDLDSDDDLVPYDMSNDLTVTAKMRPKYLRDLIADLVEVKDAENFEACLDVAEELIVYQLKLEPATLVKELLDIFLHLEEKYHVDGFEQIKFNICVAILCTQPKVAAEHLCSEIHTDLGRYSIAAKMFMLEVFSEAVTRIAAIEPTADTKPEKEVLCKQDESVNLPAEEIIRRRLIKKTRYYHSRRPHPFARAKRNEFSAVADSFFYPLIGGFGYRQLTMSVYNRKQDIDNILLYKYIAVIASLVYSTKNCLKCPQYCWEILHMIMHLRYSMDPKLQLGVLTIIAAVIVALPTSILRTEFFDQMMEVRAWLLECLAYIDLTMNAEGPSAELGALAGQVLSLLEKALADGI